MTYKVKTKVALLRLRKSPRKMRTRTKRINHCLRFDKFPHWLRKFLVKLSRFKILFCLLPKFIFGSPWVIFTKRDDISDRKKVNAWHGPLTEINWAAKQSIGSLNISVADLKKQEKNWSKKMKALPFKQLLVHTNQIQQQYSHFWHCGYSPSNHCF